MTVDVLTPFVYWAQTDKKINLKVDLTNVKDVGVYLEEKKLKFSADGQGARGQNKYGFNLDFHSEVDPDESDYKVIDRQVDFVLIKKSNAWWPRLTGQPQKPPWLKIDFDKWKSEDTEEVEEAMRDICQDYPDMYDYLHKEEFGYRKDVKKVYLILYNLFQCIGFMCIFSVMAVKYYRDGPDSMKDTYENVGNPMKFIQLLMFLEVMHPLFGYTKGSVLASLLQVGGRAFILFGNIEAEPRMQVKPVVFYLFLVWTMVEVVRYPYYLTKLLNINMPVLKWLRYTIWIPLYPLGFVFEGIIVLRNIPYFEETERFSIHMPNFWNIGFYYPTFLRLYLLMFCIPGIIFVMRHMNATRSKQLIKKKIKKK
ncbi:very-long-chain (3R)-3-hydroxyacyl-CoA dehydratase isoform X2 [Copidosoma floridanum]|uniref:very-long-chain (3R)-3-hydroxyacyl-CoA dehydratase isoform X2 n=1 Tax=Copidosoma floridanum TaxID=29053 RepID=UPI0006C9875B|nr:very-long-chain (3R)-3-hydroxyacyl-CoA dehydratase isoform X2 [Copidosoma floridanum]